MMKVYQTVEEALGFVKSNQTIMVGGFGLIGAPLTLIEWAYKKRGEWTNSN